MVYSLPKRSLIGVGLIAAGVLLLVARLHLLYFDWRVLFWGAVALAGIYRLVTGFLQHGRGVFLGTVLTALGVYQVMRQYDAVYIPGYLLMPWLLILAGTGVLLTFLAAPRRWHLLVPALFFTGLGSAIILAEEGYFDRWELIDLLRMWWPAALVLFGVALLLNRSTGQERVGP